MFITHTDLPQSSAEDSGGEPSADELTTYEKGIQIKFNSVSSSISDSSSMGGDSTHGAPPTIGVVITKVCFILICHSIVFFCSSNRFVDFHFSMSRLFKIFLQYYFWLFMNGKVAEKYIFPRFDSKLKLNHAVIRIWQKYDANKTILSERETFLKP